MKPRPASADELVMLAKAVADLHGLHGTHRESVHVREVFGDQVVWEGDVEVFDVRGNATISRAYAWSHETDEGRRRYVAVLHTRQVNSPVAAVRASLVADQRKLRA